ncbi:acyl-CoA dehydrogenase family protein [Streptomyces sp. 900105755]
MKTAHGAAADQGHAPASPDGDSSGVEPPVLGGSEFSDYFLLDNLLTDDQRALKNKVRQFMDQEVVPVINPYWERAEFPFELVPKLAQLDIAGFQIAGYGCPGMSNVTAGLVILELARGDLSISTMMGVHSALAMMSIALLGSEEQKQRFLPAMARMEKLGAFGLTEPTHGSDVVKLETTAHRDGDSYVINGHKRWIGNATFADYSIVLVDHDDMLGDPVDVAEARLQHAPVGRDGQVLGGVLPVEFVQTPLQETPVADPVGPYQGAQRNSPLCESSGVFEGGGGPLDLLQGNVVLEDVQQCAGVLRDTRPQDLDYGRVAPELRYLGDDVVPDVTADLRKA